jgi:hypothetical protein
MNINPNQKKKQVSHSTLVNRESKAVVKTIGMLSDKTPACNKCGHARCAH